MQVILVVHIYVVYHIHVENVSIWSKNCFTTSSILSNSDHIKKMGNLDVQPSYASLSGASVRRVDHWHLRSWSFQIRFKRILFLPAFEIKKQLLMKRTLCTDSCHLLKWTLQIKPWCWHWIRCQMERLWRYSEFVQYYEDNYVDYECDVGNDEEWFNNTNLLFASAPANNELSSFRTHFRKDFLPILQRISFRTRF